MTVTSAQHVDCYADHVGKGDAPWRRSFGPSRSGFSRFLKMFGCRHLYRWYEVEVALF